MASDFDRDNSIDALLKGARRDSAHANHVEARSGCLDAETLAAWADGGLDADRVGAIEAHVADCSRCQTLAAAFFTPAESAATTVPKVVPFRRNPVLYWVPIAAGTIAATLVIWLGVRDQNAVIPQAESVISESRSTQQPAATAADSQLQARQGQQANAAAPADATRSDKLRREATRAAEPAASPAPGRPATPLPVPAPVSTPSTVGLAAPPPPPPPAIVAAPPPVATTASGMAGGLVGRDSAAMRQAAEVMAKAEPRVIVEFSSVLARSETISGLPRTTGGVAGGVAGGGAGRGGRGGAGGGGRAAPVALDAAKAGAPPFYWRILSTDVIERSVDRLVWEAVAIEPPVQGLAGGTAPSATVCWIIGRAGLVLLSTDGKEFTRVTPPAPADLISIAAQDALRATITTVGGQTFTTTDGGKSWKQGT